MIKKRVGYGICFFILCVGAAMIIFPLYLTFATAFKTTEQSASNFFSVPPTFYLGNFKKVMSDNYFWTYIRNSVMITVASVAVIITFVPMVSFSISRNPYSKLYGFVYLVFVSAIFVPFQMLIVPLVKVLTSLNLMHQWGLILCYIAFSLTQGVFLFVGYMKSIPLELQQAAKMDGCTEVQTFYKIIFPLSKPMIATVGILNVLWIWNDFMLPLIVLNRSQSYWTLPLFQYNFKTTYAFDYNLACASFIFSIIPVTILYAFLQKYIIQGLTAGAVKS